MLQASSHSHPTNPHIITYNLAADNEHSLPRSLTLRGQVCTYIELIVNLGDISINTSHLNLYTDLYMS